MSCNVYTFVPPFTNLTNFDSNTEGIAYTDLTVNKWMAAGGHVCSQGPHFKIIKCGQSGSEASFIFVFYKKKKREQVTEMPFMSSVRPHLPES